ncbi:hypothetical protein ACVDG5_013820 [Mesorhizobium sp. ORM6]
MTATLKDKDQEKGDEVLRRLLRTPPKPHQEDKRRQSDQKAQKPEKKAKKPE